MEIVYHGPHDAVDIAVPFPERRETYVESGIKRDVPVTLPDEVAKALLAQGPAHWRKPKPAGAQKPPPTVKQK